jgi:hypothetical protein
MVDFIYVWWRGGIVMGKLFCLWGQKITCSNFAKKSPPDRTGGLHSKALDTATCRISQPSSQKQHK